MADEVSAIVKDTIENIIGGQTYCNTKVSQWTSSVVEGCLLGLTSLQKPFKYIGSFIFLTMKHEIYSVLMHVELYFTVNCTIMQKSGAGLHTASSCFWDNATDGCCTVRWENKTLYCIVSVFGLAI